MSDAKKAELEQLYQTTVKSIDTAELSIMEAAISLLSTTVVELFKIEIHDLLCTFKDANIAFYSQL